jgi:hypothetical protein
VDLAPDTSGYFFKEVRDALYAKGRKIVIMSELPEERRDAFDFEQIGVHGWTEEPAWGNREKHGEQKRRFGLHNDYLLRANIVDVVKTGVGVGKATLQQTGQGGMFRFYTSNLLCHDDAVPFARGDRVRFAYTSIFAPFIPLWWIGEEWDNPRSPLPDHGNTGVMYFNAIDWSKRDSGPGKAFFEDVKRYIRIRRSYPEIFENFPEHNRNANIAKLRTTRNGVANGLQAYARYAGGKAVLVAPNYDGDGAGADFRIAPDAAALGLSGAARYKITDLMTGKVVVEKSAPLESFTAFIPAGHLGVYLVEGH